MKSFKMSKKITSIIFLFILTFFFCLNPVFLIAADENDHADVNLNASEENSTAEVDDSDSVQEESFDEAEEVIEEELSQEEFTEQDLMEEVDEMTEADLGTESAEIILQRERVADQIEDLKRQLLGQLAEYRQQERNYRISIDQFERLQTLQSIEDAVNNSQMAMIHRNQVLDTYLNLLRLQLIEAGGIELSHKQKAIESIEKDRLILLEFKARLNQDLDRDDIKQIADDFLPVGENIAETSYYALSLLAVGRLQAVYDQALVLHERIKEKDTSNETLVEQTERQRALREVDRLAGQLLTAFRDIRPQLDPGQYRYRTGYYESTYKSMFRNLNTIYSKLSQLVSFLEELEGLK